jgi:heme/copper-type cytochrome/quinol oxidase subunit 2
VRTPLILLGLVWIAFLVIFPFAAAGDTSFLHIGAHLVQLPLLLAATLLAWRQRRAAVTRAQRMVSWVLSVSVPAAVVGVGLELVTAVVRLAEDGWVNQDTADVWERGPHAVVASLTIPSMMVSMLAVLALAVTTAVQGRRHSETDGSGQSSPTTAVVTHQAEQ